LKITRYPGLLKSLSGTISKVNDSRQLAYSNAAAIANNNKVIAAKDVTKLDKQGNLIKNFENFKSK
jgi:hypothetical protein